MGRFVVGVLVASVMGDVVFLIMVQGSFRKGHTDLDFNHVLGTMAKGTAEETSGNRGALGVVGDTAGPTGFYATLVGAIVLLSSTASWCASCAATGRSRAWAWAS